MIVIMTARFLYCIPSSSLGSRRHRSASVPESVYSAYERRIRNLLEEECGAEPEIITLSPEADAMIEAFAEELEPRLVREYAEIVDWAGKLVGNVIRISALLCRIGRFRSHEFFAEQEPLEVSAEEMTQAIRIGRYFLEHAKGAFLRNLLFWCCRRMHRAPGEILRGLFHALNEVNNAESAETSLRISRVSAAGGAGTEILRRASKTGEPQLREVPQES